MDDAVFVLHPPGFGFSAHLSKHEIDDLNAFVAFRFANGVGNRNPFIIISEFNFDPEWSTWNIGEGLSARVKVNFVTNPLVAHCDYGVMQPLTNMLFVRQGFS
ncbi:hypothetical protein B217_07874 [Bifidobacterium bifidum IPLA 20015]|nr:hypothetical protein B217_07874 [Bifidobacterium bifidum IPLA 20015]